MQKMFQKVLNQYQNNMSTAFEANDFAKYIRTDTKQIITLEANLDERKYIVEGSPGKGNWAIIPWIAVFDKSITTTAAKGYDIVYLFNEDMSGFYLSLNQGWTYYETKYGVKKGLEKIEEVSSYWRNLLHIPDDFLCNEIDLKISKGHSYSARSKTRGYELGHICGKYYKKEEIPSNEILVKDLQDMLTILDQLKKLTLGPIQDSFFSLNQTNAKTNTKTEGNLEEKITGTLRLVPTILAIKKGTKKKSNHPIDYLNKAKQDQELGLYGEKLVLAYEKQYLIEHNRPDLADKVEHVSITKGDQAGYDILSYTPEGVKKYIEVKTTTKGYQDRFFISSNEVEFAKANQEQYYLYRVYSFKNKNGNLHIFDYKELNQLNLIPKEYFASFDLNGE